VNRGIGGQTTSQMLVRFRPDVLALGPRAVVILAGTNDIAGNSGPVTLETIEQNLATMAELARVHAAPPLPASRRMLARARTAVTPTRSWLSCGRARPACEWRSRRGRP